MPDLFSTFGYIQWLRQLSINRNIWDNTDHQTLNRIADRLQQLQEKLWRLQRKLWERDLKLGEERLEVVKRRGESFAVLAKNVRNQIIDHGENNAD